MKTIILHGSLADQFGERFEMDVRDPSEALRALMTQLKGFADIIKNGAWHVFRGEVRRGNDLSPGELGMGVGREREIHIMPQITGAGGGGIFQTLVGAVLIGAAAFLTGGLAIAALGIGGGLLLNGITQMLTTTAATTGYEESSADERSSFLFDGPVNTSTQGLPVPLIYGKVLTGSAVVSAGMWAERVLDDE